MLVSAIVLAPLGEAGTVYPTLDVTGAWGRITTESGARITGDWKTLVFGVEDRARLTLNPGWTLKAGPRAGDMLVVPAPKK
jgi:hypothetical protein